MKKVIALVGRPNVGKSTLFNRLTRTRDALVADEPGLTRDRRYGRMKYEEQELIVIDTGGISREDGIDGLITDQAKLAIEESDVVIFLVDGRAGLTSDDHNVANILRLSGKKVIVAINKTEGINKDTASVDFFALGFGALLPCSAAHGDGISSLLEEVAVQVEINESPIEDELDDLPGIKVAIIGRPNVGKSTLVNRLLGEDRVLAFDMPGTTRDSIYVPFEHQQNKYILIDTAGVRRKSKVNDKIEKFSIVKTLQAIENCNVVVLVLDAKQGIASQDASLLGYIIESGKGLLIAVNKWDNLDESEKSLVRKELDRKLSFIDYASVHFVSALHGSGVGRLMSFVNNIYQASRQTFATHYLTQILEDAVSNNAPPMISGRRIKLRYAHQGGKNPPVIVVHGNQADKVPKNYQRYLSNIFRKVLNLAGNPIKIEFKAQNNPYKNKKNTLTPRQENKRKRLKKFIKKKKRK